MLARGPGAEMSGLTPPPPAEDDDAKYALGGSEKSTSVGDVSNFTGRHTTGVVWQGGAHGCQV